MKATFKDFIGIYENAFPKEYCDHLIKTFQQYKKSSIRRPNVNHAANDISLGIFPVLDQNSKNAFYRSMSNIIDQYIDQYRILSEHTHNGYQVTDIKVQQTEPSEGYHTWHCEFSPTSLFFKRWGVWSLYLNDVEKGGETEFLYQSIRVKPKTGTVCIFPSYFTHAHRGNPPLKNTKYLATGWIEYPEKYIKNASLGNQMVLKEMNSQRKKNDS